MKVTQFRKKPVVIEAIQLSKEPDNVAEVALIEFLRDADWSPDGDGGLVIRTLEGNMRADAGDYIIRGVKGEFYPCKPDIFAATYEEA